MLRRSSRRTVTNSRAPDPTPPIPRRGRDAITKPDLPRPPPDDPEHAGQHTDLPAFNAGRTRRGRSPGPSRPAPNRVVRHRDKATSVRSALNAETWLLQSIFSTMAEQTPRRSLRRMATSAARARPRTPLTITQPADPNSSQVQAPAATARAARASARSSNGPRGDPISSNRAWRRAACRSGAWRTA